MGQQAYKAGVMQEELLKQTFKAMHRKFSESAKVWLLQIAHYQKAGDAEGARKMLQNATQSAPPRKHIKVCSTRILTKVYTRKR